MGFKRILPCKSGAMKRSPLDMVGAVSGEDLTCLMNVSHPSVDLSSMKVDVIVPKMECENIVLFGCGLLQDRTWLSHKKHYSTHPGGSHLQISTEAWGCCRVL